MSRMLEYIEHILGGPTSVLVKMIEIVPDEKIQYKPYTESMSIPELVCHILSVMQIHVYAISEGQGKEEHAQRIPIEPESITTAKSLVLHLNKVLHSIKDELQRITPENLERSVVYKQWNDYEIQGGFALQYIIEEFFHHRGQLSVYLRLLELEPPFLYKY
ncbi:MAG: DinB family protein [Candidatus Thorarchaeota archaeon]